MAERRSLVDPLASPAIRELTGDEALLGAMIDAELALAAALREVGVVDTDLSPHAEEIRSAVLEQLDAVAEEARAGGNPVIPLVPRLRAAAEAASPGSGAALHLGATSQDVLDTAVMVRAAAVLERIDEELVRLGEALAALADRHRATPMVGRTLGQHAAPTVFGAVSAERLGAVTAALAAVRRTRTALPAQLGGAVGTLAALVAVVGERTSPADAVERTLRVVAGYADRLGLRAPAAVWHTDRTPVVELASALGLAAGAAGAVALDVTLLARTETAELGESLGAGEGGSSAMPHKRNPIGAVLVVAAARQAPGLVGSLFAALAAEDQRPSGAWHAEWRPLQQLQEAALGAVTGAADLVASLEVRPDAMREHLVSGDGSVFSEDVATLLGERLGRAEAFALLGRASRESAATGRPLRVVVSGLLGPDEALQERVARAFEPSSSPGVTGAWIDAAIARFATVRDSAAAPEGETAP
ncbi:MULTISPECIES: lyase family protein [unclassified Rathayibacter]|uniref:lyase family protein n=1 Tax=unclassified Rathayibacter TaxID=2609250 RepID=UPI000CE7D619|nr:MULTISPECIES: lyase family protein [unclassified Rathayibacter]PPI41686.1 3-carboxy-cis,cis-muconate cycloisomerase [Rathayibacter sp. RFBD1]PPI63187.1 3-carboxy-cis,cis-muconate cycloisomerase [Rathayibacter sp. TRS19]